MEKDIIAMEIRIIIPDNYVWIDGVAVQLEALPTVEFEITNSKDKLVVAKNGTKRIVPTEETKTVSSTDLQSIHKIDDKVHIQDRAGNGRFLEGLDLDPFIDVHAAEVAAITAAQEAAEAEREAYLVSWDYIRDQRAEKLAASDWTQLPDSPMNGNQDWLDYRQALRDITDSFTTPGDVIWPQEPS